MPGSNELGATGRRERNKQRVRARIYDSAVELFTRKGYDATTIDEIADHADVARGTVFNHFQRKEDLITEWAEIRRRTMTERLQLPLSLEATSASAILQLCLSTLAQVNEEERGLTETMLMAWVKAGKPLTEAPYTAEVFTSIVSAGLRHGEIAPQVDPHLLGEILRDVYLGALYRWTRENGAAGTLAQDLRSVLWILMNGIIPRV
ncbi:TetR/AcrR family transcriptional regulator [Nocardia salmonicida]|uniref:TetR/AcrR family transcriptional regulator n=1 Tax=Nocardia salmonicida TaxID=53431 RepID=UPI00378B7D17